MTAIVLMLPPPLALLHQEPGWQQWLMHGYIISAVNLMEVMDTLTQKGMSEVAKEALIFLSLDIRGLHAPPRSGSAPASRLRNRSACRACGLACLGIAKMEKAIAFNR